MDQVEHVKPNFPADAFAGTAAYYVRYRLPYPQGLLIDLLHRSGITGEGGLLDLACGPGRVALAVGSSFQEVWAVDLEPEMIEAGKKEAARRERKTSNGWWAGPKTWKHLPPHSN
jgi:predicted RNA methylase